MDVTSVIFEDEDGFENVVVSTSPVRNNAHDARHQEDWASIPPLMMAEEAFAQTKKQYLSVLMLPTVLQLLEFTQLSRINELCKSTRDTVKVAPQSCGYWNAMCLSLCAYKMLYTPHLYELSSVDEKNSKIPTICNTAAYKHFHSDLWGQRGKWGLPTTKDGGGEESAAPDSKEGGEFKIRVLCRFRPGERGKNDMSLPLHQFLKMRRKEHLHTKEQEQESASGSGSSSILVGEQDPPEFLDPFLNVLMRDPVLLTTSNRVIERAIAVQCVLRNGRDPFNNRKLAKKNIVAQPELQARIQEWKVTKERNNNTALKVNLTQVKKALIDENAVDPELLEILQEAEKLSAQADKTERLSRRRKRFDKSGSGAKEDEQEQEQEEEEQHISEAERAAALLDPHNIPQDNHGSNDENSENVDRRNAEGGGALLDTDDTSSRKSLANPPRVIDVSEKQSSVSMHITGIGVRNFNFSHVYDGSSTQPQLFDSAIRPTVSHVMNGFNSSILCYGQTGSGKTYTFFGPDSNLHCAEAAAETLHEYIGDPQHSFGVTGTVNHRALPDSIGLSVRVCVELLLAKRYFESRGVNVSITMQYIEIYEESVTDLMTGNAVDVRRESGDLVHASEVALVDVPSMLQVLQLGQERKRFAATAMNERSSRSHTAMIIHVLQVDAAAASASAGAAAADSRMLRSTLHLVDLAGSERIKKSKVSGARMNEAIGINSSLLVLGKCIAALVESKSHIPYLESKLTTMLRSAFGGNSRTTAIMCARGDDANGDETLQTMRFGERCSMISNKTRSLATSAESTLEALNASLAKVQEQLLSLERRGKSHLPSFLHLQASCQQIKKKRDDLAVTVQRKSGGKDSADVSAARQVPATLKLR